MLNLQKKILVLVLALVLAACANTRMHVHTPNKPLKDRKIENVGVALVLGSGGSRGMAHLGVIDILEKNNIPIDLIVGSSAGSIIGALYADYKDSKLLYKTLIDLRKWDILDLSLLDAIQFFADLRAPVQGFYLEDFMIKNMTVHNIEDLKIPFVAVATDLHNRSAFRISSGPIAIAVHASSAVPPIFTPVHAYGKLLVDGGVTEPVPVTTAKSYNPKLTIAVDITTFGSEYEGINMYEITMKSMDIAYYALSQSQSKDADIRIHPNTHGFGMFDDYDNELLFRRGQMAAIEALPQIKKMLKERGIKY